jgi:hypothetical protein
MRSIHAVASVALLLGAGCGATPVASANAKGKVSEAPSLTGDEVKEVIRGVAAARQLPARRAVDFHLLPRQAFVSRLLAEEGDGNEGGDELSPNAARLLGFDFVPPPEARAGLSTARQVLEEQVSGFYDHRTRLIYVPRVPLRSESDAIEQRAVVAHEAQHALQDQHFGEVLRDKEGGEDQRLARLALIEGDAMVAMGAWLGAAHGAPVGRTVRRIADVTRKVPLERFRHDHGPRTRLGRAPALMQAQLRFPYEEGMLFVADMYRAGGFPLVDRLYQRPPASTEQVLHPEKYVAGELPRPIATLPLPPGHRSLVDESLGELAIRALLSQCLRPDEAERAAAGWNGDRFVVAADTRRALSVGWVTAWDDEREAVEAEAALTGSAACWKENRLGLDSDDYTVGSGFGVSRQGATVVFVRGLDPGARRTWAAKLTGLPGAAPPPQALAGVTIPERVPLPEPRRGRIAGSEYRSAWLGVSAQVPAGLEGSIDEEGLELTVSRSDTLVRGALAVSDRVVNAEQNEQTFAGVERSFAAVLGEAGVTVEGAGAGTARTPLGKGTERRWRGAGTTVEMRMILVPICGGTGSVVLVTASADPLGKSVLDGWIESLRWINGRNVVACGYLDPK